MKNINKFDNAKKYTDKYFMDLAWKISQKSHDISTQVGCIIVDEKNKVVAKGFNDFPHECHKTKYLTNQKPTRYLLSVHAEMRALLTSNKKNFSKCRIYVTHASCDNCMKHIIISGIKEIIYDKLHTNGHFIDIERQDAIVRLIKSSDIIVRNINNGKTFIDDIKLNN